MYMIENCIKALERPWLYQFSFKVSINYR